MERQPAPLFVLTGMSGAGKSTALRTFEDHGYFCIDNLPPSLIETFLTLYREGRTGGRGVAIVCDIRSGDLFTHLRDAVGHMRQHGYDPQVIYFDCQDEILVARFAAARRQPPLSEGLLPLQAVQAERQLLEPLKDLAAHTIDTSELTSAQLRERIRGMLGIDGTGSVVLTILTFGYKHGVPPDADFVFDTRFLPNPFYVDELRELTGREAPVRDYIFESDLAKQYLDHIEQTLAFALQHFAAVGKHFGVVALGCTGGRHRSVCLAEELARRMSTRNISTSVQHRDIDR